MEYKNFALNSDLESIDLVGGVHVVPRENDTFVASLKFDKNAESACLQFIVVDGNLQAHFIGSDNKWRAINLGNFYDTPLSD